MIQESSKKVFELLKYGLGNTNNCIMSEQTDWSEILNTSFIHRVGAVALDGLQRCIDENVPIEIDFQTKLKWIGAVHQQELAFKRQEETIASLADFYHQYGIKMMVLKGWGLSRNYPKPEHRPCSDLDIYLFGEQERADKLIENELGIKVDNSHHCHSVFVYHGVTVENHYDFLNVNTHPSTKKIEKKLKELSSQDLRENQISGATVILPSVDFDALFVLRHMAEEFSANGMYLRQVIDWGLFVKKYHNEINWDSLLALAKEMNMYYFMEAVSYICYKYLGFEKIIFKVVGKAEYGEKVLKDLFNPANFQPKAKGVFKYVVQRCKNWWLNRWRHKIVYSDSLLSTFVYQIHAHLMKPATLRH